MIIKKKVTESIKIGKLSLDMQIERTKRKKTISLQIKDNKLIIKAPKIVSRKSLDELIQRKKTWIKQRAIMNFEEQNLRNREFIDNEKLYFRGNAYRLSLIFGEEKTVKIVEDLLVVTLMDDEPMDREGIKTLLEEWYFREAFRILKTRTNELAKKMKVKPRGMTVKNYISKWGSCTIHHKISYNWRIIMAPDYIIDYLIVHELSHIIEPNHSNNFWQHVENHCDDFKKKRNWLRENGHRLVL